MSLREKKEKVLPGPKMAAMPAKNSSCETFNGHHRITLRNETRSNTLPRIRRALSKKKMTPKKRKKTPSIVMPIPISVKQAAEGEW